MLQNNFSIWQNMLFILSTKSHKTSYKNNFLKRDTTLEHRCITRCLNDVLSTNWIGQGLEILFQLYKILLEMIFYTRKLWYFKTIHIKSFFVGCFFLIQLSLNNSLLQMLLQAKHDFHPDAFSMFFIYFYNMIQLCSFLLFLN